MRRIWSIGVGLMFLSMGMRCRAPTKEEPRPETGCFHGEVVNVSCDTLYSASPDLATDGRGNLYLVWGSLPSRYDYNNLRCVFRAKVNGEWTEIDTVSTGPTWGCFVAADPQGRVHVVWEEYLDETTRVNPPMAVMYRMRDIGGNWLSPDTVSVGIGIRQARVGVDPTGRVHVIWGGHYASRSPEGVWDVFEENVPIGENPFMTVDSAGGVHVVWQPYPTSLAYSYRDPGGKWLREDVASSPRGYAIIADQDVFLWRGAVWISAVIASDSVERGWSWGLWKRELGQWVRVETPLDSRYLSSVRVAPAGGVLFVTYMMWEETPGGWRAKLLWGCWEGGWVEAGTLAVYEDREPILFVPSCGEERCWGVWTVEEGEGIDYQYEVWVKEIRMGKYLTGANGTSGFVAWKGADREGTGDKGLKIWK